MASQQIAFNIVLAFILGSKHANGNGSLTQSDEDITISSNFFREIEDNSRYRTLEANATLLKLLVDDKEGVSRSEVLDMLNSRDNNPRHVKLPSFAQDREIAKDDNPFPNSQAEYLQASSIFMDEKKSSQYWASGSRAVAVAAMMLTTAGLVLAAYVTFVLTRKTYLMKNGLKHELLQNEDNIAETRIDI